MTATHAELTVKARLRNFGDGVLVLADDAVKFYVETGRFRKRRKVIREISLADVESVERQGNDLSIFWKGATDMFVIAQPSQVEPTLERIMAALKGRTKEAENKETADQKQVELAQLTAKAKETADSLFDILKSLHGRVDWSLVENSFKQSEENVKSLASQANSLCLDITQLSAAVQERFPKEIAEKTYDVLKTMYEHFDGMASSGDNAEQFHPNHQDARLVIQANYVLNDMLLGVVVGDDAVEKEGVELLKVLYDLSKVPGSKIDVNAVKASLDKICAEKEKQGLVVEEIRLMLGQQLKELISPTASHQPNN
jgi:hypothetical protein